MRISEVRIQNYRTITNLSIKFPKYDTAICGKNDAGKSNIIRVLRSAFQKPDRMFFMPDPDISVKDDFTKWRQKDVPASERFIQVDFVLQISQADDEGLHLFLVTYLSLPDELKAAPILAITLSIKRIADEKAEQVGLSIDGKPYEVLKAQEVYKRLQSTSAILFHDSTEFFHPYRFRQSADVFREMSPSDERRLKDAQENVGKVLTKVAKRNQEDLTEMLGRLKDKYKIGFSIINTAETNVPYTITLGTDDGDVELENWGSGTQNRTRILMTLFKASKIRETSTSSEKVVPVIVIEEPESYLHPSAQAEFGRTLRDLAEEFKIQVVVTTHSPYLLSLDEPEANILLKRTTVKKGVRETGLIDTSGDKWVEPFSLALGLSEAELGPWKDALFSGRDSVLLVEGEIDKSYLELLRSEVHGTSRFVFDGIIFPYGGKDTLRHKDLLRFIMSRFKHFIVTYDLDVEAEVEVHLKELGLAKGSGYIAVGKNAPTKKCIEGLLPEQTFQSVFSKNVQLVQKATGAVTADARSAKSSLKKLYFREFETTAKPLTDDYKDFYTLAKQLNKMVEKKQVKVTSP
ncbi:MAG: ATP-binding protein [Acidobacteria bacterium]|nr:ATP-binding protein [Acidobacteriota bacterium]